GAAETEFRQALAESLLAQGRGQEAFDEIDPVYQAGRAKMPEAYPALVEARTIRAMALVEAGRDEEAAPELETIYRLDEPLYGGISERCRAVARARVKVAEHAHDDAAAAAWRAKL